MAVPDNFSCCHAYGDNLPVILFIKFLIKDLAAVLLI